MTGHRFPIRRRAWPRPAALVLAAALIVPTMLAGCGIPRDSEPREVTVDNDLLSPTSTTSIPSGPLQVPVYFPIEDVRLERVIRRGESDSDPELALKLLMAGPDEGDRERKLSTSIPNGTEVIDTIQDDDLLTVNLNEGIDTIQGQTLTTAFAQMVFTATSVKGERVSRVQFQVNGEPRQALSDDGQLDIVTRINYSGTNTPDQ